MHNYVATVHPWSVWNVPANCTCSLLSAGCSKRWRWDDGEQLEVQIIQATERQDRGWFQNKKISHRLERRWFQFKQQTMSNHSPRLERCAIIQFLKSARKVKMVTFIFSERSAVSSWAWSSPVTSWDEQTRTAWTVTKLAQSFHDLKPNQV